MIPNTFSVLVLLFHQTEKTYLILDTVSLQFQFVLLFLYYKGGANITCFSLFWIE